MDTMLGQLSPARNINRVGNSLPFGKAMGFQRRPGDPCQPSSNPTEVSTPFFAPTLLRTARDS